MREPPSRAGATFGEVDRVLLRAGARLVAEHARGVAVGVGQVVSQEQVAEHGDTEPGGSSDSRHSETEQVRASSGASERRRHASSSAAPTHQRKSARELSASPAVVSERSDSPRIRSYRPQVYGCKSLA